MPLKKNSIYEQLFPLTTIMKQRVVDDFSGDSLDERWTTTNIAGTGTFAVSDEIDGGFSITTGATSGNNSSINFNNIRQYNFANSILIAVAKMISTTSSQFDVGLCNDTGFAGTHYAKASNDASNAQYYLQTKDGTTASASFSDINIDTSWHNHKLILGSSNVKYYIDGALKVTKTNNMPAVALQPEFQAYTQTALAKESRIRYIEAYNI